MASRYLKAAIPTLEPGYVPLPLNFINEKITADQTKFDTAASQIATLNALKQDVAPWDKGKEQDLLGKYTPQINELSEMLYKTGQVGQVVPSIAKLQQQWQNDPTRKYLQQGFDWYTTTELPREKEKGYAEAYNELKNPDGSWKSDINNYQLQGYKYVPWDNDKWIQDNLNNWVANSYAKATGADSAEVVMVNGVPQIKETRQGKTETKGIGPEFGAYYQDAINALTDQVMTGDFDAATWLKGKKGEDRKAILDYITNLAIQKKFMQTDLNPGVTTYGNLPEGYGSSAGNKPIDDFVAMVTPVPLETKSGETYTQIVKNIDNIQKKQDIIKNSYQQASASILEQFPDLVNYVKANIKNGADPITTMDEGFSLAVKYAESLPNITEEDKSKKLAIQGALANINKEISNYNVLESQKYVFEQERKFVDDEITKRIYNGDVKSKLDNYTVPLLVETDVTKHIKGFDELSESDRSQVINIIREENHGIGGFSPSTLDKLWNILVDKNSPDTRTPVLGDPGFNAHVGGLYQILKPSLANNSLYEGIKFDAKALYIEPIGELKSNTEQWDKALQGNFKGMSMDAISRTSGFASSKDMLGSATFIDGTIDKPENYSVDNVRLIQSGATPTALYTFKSSKNKSTVSVVAPLSTLDNRKLVQDSAIEMFNKATVEENPALRNTSAQLLVTSSLDEDEYGKLLFLFRANPSDYKPITFNIMGTDAEVSKVKSGYLVQVTSTDNKGNKVYVDNPVPVSKEEDVLTALGTLIMGKIQTQAFGTSGGGSYGMGKGTTWTPQ